MNARLAVLVVAVFALFVPAVISAQDPFRVTHTVDKSNSAQTRITGTVSNEGRLDAVDVYVTAEALDGAGKTVARGISFVSPGIAPGRSAPFNVSVPAVPNAASYRVRVSGFRFGGLQSP